MILSDRSIREEIAAGRIVIDPYDESCVQPSSVDLHIDRYFRVFRNHTTGFIDVKDDQEDLTELVEIAEDDVFILHPGEFVLGSTSERVAIPNDLVARLDGKSSLGRLGLLIHSSLPASEPVLVLDETGLRQRPIGEVVEKRIEGSVVSYDPETFEAAFSVITGWYQGPADRIFEVKLASGRSVRVTAGHNLFGLDRQGRIEKLRVQQLSPGRLVAIPGRIPEPAGAHAVYDLRGLVPEALLPRMVVSGPTVTGYPDWESLGPQLIASGRKHVGWYRERGVLPAHIARTVPAIWDRLGPADRMRPKGARYGLPVVWEIDAELAWLIGFYVAEGHRRPQQVTFANTDEALLDRVEATLRRWGLPVYRTAGTSVTCASSMLSSFLDWIGTGGKAPTKRIPADALGWPDVLLPALLQGLLDGGGMHDAERRCYFSCSPALVGDLLALAPRMDCRATASFRAGPGLGLYQVSMPTKEHKLQTSVPLPDRLLATYARHLDRSGEELARLDRLANGAIAWDRVESVEDTGSVEPVYDLEVRPGGRKVENFVAGSGGVFVSNTAGFVDAGWNGHLTLELSNVANLPITLYPGMKIGQISFLKMTTEADIPYGSKATGSKYQHQRGPTPSRYFENFKPRP